MRKTKDTSVRIPEEMRVKIEALLPVLRGYTLNGFVEEAVLEILELIDTPSHERDVPPLVKHADAVRTRRPLPTSSVRPSLDAGLIEDAGAGETGPSR